MLSNVGLLLLQKEYRVNLFCDIVEKLEEECSEPKPHSNVIQNGAERKSISKPALLIPSLPTGREGTIEL